MAARTAAAHPAAWHLLEGKASIDGRHRESLGVRLILAGEPPEQRIVGREEAVLQVGDAVGDDAPLVPHGRRDAVAAAERLQCRSERRHVDSRARAQLRRRRLVPTAAGLTRHDGRPGRCRRQGRRRRCGGRCGCGGRYGDGSGGTAALEVIAQALLA
eukprot:scaffold16579_cov58-Phaeocystis_antarctica.AAC.2